jgi:hypothetical protein
MLCNKIIVDASFHADMKKGGWGFIVRDSTGEFLGGAGNIPRAACPAVHYKQRRWLLSTVCSVLPIWV